MKTKVLVKYFFAAGGATAGFTFRRLKGLFKYLLLIVAGFIFAAPLCAQQQQRTISGVVADEQNAPLRGAQVSLENADGTVARVTTGADGRFSFAVVAGPNFRLRVAAEGFAPFAEASDNLPLPLVVILRPENLREQVTVSILRSESRLSETPASIVVLTRETLTATAAAQSADDALRQIAGFTLFRRSSSRTANPTTQGANLRGLAGSGASRAAILLDGLSLNDAFGGWTFWSRAPLVAVEQAEVLRGGASAFYGDSALSGAVNLITSKPKKDRPVVRLQTSAGTQATFDASVFAAAEWQRGWSFDAALETFQTAGYVPTVEAERGAADARANSRHNNAIFTIKKRFGADDLPQQQQQRRDAGIFENAGVFLRGNLFAESRDNGTSLTGNRAYFRQAAFGADFGNEKFGALEFRSFIEKQIYDQTFSAVSGNRNAESLSRVQRVPSQAFGANLFWSKAFAARHVVSGSLEFREVRGFSDETIFVDNRAGSLVGAGGRERAFAVFAQDVWRAAPNLHLSAGARFDFRKNFDALSSVRNLTSNQTSVTEFFDRRESAFSPRVAALYQFNRNFSAVAAYAASFRAPTLNELYRVFRVGNVLTLANENLKSERADTFESGLNFAGFARKLNLRGNFFVAEVSRPVVSITLVSTPNLITRQRQNVGRTRSRGLELDAEFLPRNDWRFSAGFLLVDSRVTDFPTNPLLIGKFLPQVARRQLTFQTAYRPTAKFVLSLQGRISDAQFEDDLNRLRLRPYFTLDAFAARRLFKKLEIFAAVENVFDNRYDIGLTPNRTVAAPRFARAGLRFDLANK